MRGSRGHLWQNNVHKALVALLPSSLAVLLQGMPRISCCSAAEDIDTSKMHGKMEFVAIDQLAAYADKKVSSGWTASHQLGYRADGHSARLP